MKRPVRLEGQTLYFYREHYQSGVIRKVMRWKRSGQIKALLVQVYGQKKPMRLDPCAWMNNHPCGLCFRGQIIPVEAPDDE